ncbi:MAG: bifunctional riboflavin kinase/FAD synthetase [Nitrospirae bacterium]|nr:bifunctional riboflavin kinase/FAD synthetase [Nitrospirota bacterium]
MEIIRGPKGQGRRATYPVAAIGNFDGVHRGHQAILKQTVDRAKVQQGTGIVLTFEPHPLKVLAPSLDLKFLMTFEERLHWIERIGVQQVRCMPFTHDFANLTPQEFVQSILHDEIGAKEIFVGDHFVFGKDRKGTVRDLQLMGRDLDFLVHAVEPVRVGDRAISSSRIRECLFEGHVAEAREFLGRPYTLAGRIIPGAHRGKRLGYPTANFRPPQDRVIPRNGIYAVRAELEGHAPPGMLDGVTYIGIQPTMGTHERMVETHLFKPQTELYGRTIRVSFVEWIRPELVFKNPTELVHQMEEDLRKAKAILSEAPFSGIGS